MRLEITFMRFRHALASLAAAIPLILVVSSAPAAAAEGATLPVMPSVSASASGPATSAVDARQRAEQAIVAMTSGGARTGSALVVAPGLVVTSLHVLKFDKAGTTMIMTVDGGFVPFTKVAEDKRLGLVLLRANGLEAKPIVMGKGRELVADQPVIALGIGQQGRSRILEQGGKMKSPAAATGNDLMITDILIDPLVEGGPLIGADGKVVGIVVAKSQGDIAGGTVGWAVPIEAVQEYVKAVQAKQAAEAARNARRTVQRIIAWSILLTFFLLMALAARAFRKWYKAMEAREEAAMAAEAARAAAEGRDAAEE